MLATPHIAGYSAQGKANASSAVVRALSREFGLPPAEWYPSEVAPCTPRTLSWQALCSTIDGHFDIAALSRELKRRPGEFEAMRDQYRYREEYF